MGSEKLNDIIFFTGATGFVGTQIVRRLIKKADICIIVLIRGKTFEEAHKHLSRAWWEWPELMEEIEGLNKINLDNYRDNKINLINGDLSEENLGLENSIYNSLVNNVTHIIHTAADIRLNASLDDLRRINVNGTENLLKLASNAHKNHGISRFSHLSTAYVAGGRTGNIAEDSLTDNCGFLSNYERSKYEGELKVKQSGLPISIFRPGMVVGDSKTGYLKTFNTIYVLIRLYLNNQLSLMPVSRNVKINLVPVDYLADAVTELTFEKNAEGLTFHVTAPYSTLPNVEEFMDFIQKWAYDNLQLKISKPLFLSPSTIPYISNFLKITGNTGNRLSKIMKELAPYLNEDREFSRDNSTKFLGHYNLDWKKFLPILLDYAIYNGFFHRSERTVHEQILFRLNSFSRPIKYYDIVDNQFLPLKQQDMRTNIINALKALEILGVKPGDRVAIVGFNNTRYLTLDISIGLLGAVCVPIYYTSPVDDIIEILDDCGAKVIFIGTPYLLDHLNKFTNVDIVVSFCNDSANTKSNILSWNEFLSTGMKEHSKSDREIVSPVDFNDVATIRYTSGTTGKPSGVMFTHGNLRWMAEYVASMPPWKERTKQVTYLSFLPMNHVIEGILGIYAPYYAPASLKLYFLENFQDLEITLPKVRPTIFFSVPRFYEKVWSRIKKSWWGNQYLNVNNGTLKNILRRILRRSVLKQTGLDECAQLIVGSAPISIDLLMSFRDLSIEIHNAYGLTEAPLVTINRLGSNRIGTVGEPLPKTDIKIVDGEVLIRGPQVTPGYFKDKNRNDLNFKNHWLLTGDYGYQNEEGSLIITGRKKELIVNSYGKTISPLKIEGMLKHINGVSEVMLIGDEKPYCTSLIWVDETINPEELSIRIEKVNSKLSHPEKIKRWAILKDDLTIENGELTANLKLKRENIIKRYQKLVNNIYDDNFRSNVNNKTSTPNLIYLGETHEY
jgi:long-chain acyl-CoA synthetase